MRRVVGITGGIASGKSLITEILRDLGYSVIDADAIAKELSEKGGSVYQRIVEVFGREYLCENNELDRKRLGAYVFKNPDRLRQLNEISHPLIVEKIGEEIKKNEKNLIFLDIPLLFEAKLEYLCDTIVCVYVSKETQAERLMLRDSIERAYALQKIESQMSLDEKKERSDFVLYNTGDKEETKKELLKIIKEIKGE